MLNSRLQTARYRRPGLMLLIQRLAHISARAHRYMGQVSSSTSSDFHVFMSYSLAVYIRLLAKPVLRIYYPDSRRGWMDTARTSCGIPYTLSRLHSSPFDRCEFPGILFRGFVNYDRYRWSHNANKIQIHTDVKSLSEFVSCITNDVERDNP